MATPSKDFRENPKRAIYVLGGIDQQQVYRITPEILRLRSECSDPITVYIDSYGGETLCAEDIRSLLYAPDQDAKVCRVITVVTVAAASAAADLLALGDYAIAYRNAWILYHGTRQTPQVALTTEKAESLAKTLKQSNEQFALRLARKAFRRCIFHYGNVAGEFEELKKKLATSDITTGDTSELACFAVAIAGRLSPGNLQDVPLTAFKRQQAIGQLNEFIFSRAKFKGEDPMAAKQAEVLKLILDYELDRKRDKDWLLSTGGLLEVEDDFNLFNDYFLGEYRNYLALLIPELGDLFLNDVELKEWKALAQTDESHRNAWLKEKVEHRIHPLWYFVVCLFRLLQQGEFSLTARDAYWLGIVDEVIGASDLPTQRLILESQPSAPAPSQTT